MNRTPASLMIAALSFSIVRGAEKMSKARKAGDRVSFAASQSADNRRVYTGTVERVDGSTCYVRDDDFGAISSVAMARCHDAGAFRVMDAGPVGIRWTDTSRLLA